MKDVEGKVAFITGGASGAGFGMASVFSKAGMKVVIADILQDRLDQAMTQLDPSRVHPVRLDVPTARISRGQQTKRSGFSARFTWSVTTPASTFLSLPRTSPTTTGIGFWASIWVEWSMD